MIEDGKFFRFHNRGFIFETDKHVDCYLFESEKEFLRFIETRQSRPHNPDVKKVWNGPGWYLYQVVDFDFRNYELCGIERQYLLASFSSLCDRIDRFKYRFENQGKYRDDDPDGH